MKEWIAGRNPVYECLRAGRRHFFRLWLAKGVEHKGKISEILTMAAERKLQMESVERGQLADFGDNPQGVALQVSAYPYVDLGPIIKQAKESAEPLFILMLDSLQDPQNLGTLMRTAEAVGVHGIVIPEHRSASVTPAVVHASSGASEHMKVAQMNLVQAIDLIKSEDGWVVGLESGENAQAFEPKLFSGALALVVGSERHGMRDLVKRKCDHLVRLPMRGKVDSMNAAVAGSIALYLAFLQRKKQ